VVCSVDEAIPRGAHSELGPDGATCLDDCYFDGIETKCESDRGDWNQRPDICDCGKMQARGYPLLISTPQSQIPCPHPAGCDVLVNVEKPSVLNLVLAHLAQSLVVTCIGLNMGLR
jgi:hypothetical protein